MRIIFFVLLIILITLVVGCSVDNTKWKVCDRTEDCKSVNGGGAGCWNIDFPEKKIRTNILLAGPGDCICYENECQSSRKVVSLVYEEDKDINASAKICELNINEEYKEWCYRQLSSKICLSNENLCLNCLDDCSSNKNCKIACLKTGYDCSLECKEDNQCATTCYCKVYEEQTSNNNLKDACVKNRAISEKNIDLCKDLFSLEEQNKCLKEIGIATNNVSVCLKIPRSLSDLGGSTYSSCLMKISISTQNVSVCSLIYYLENDNACYLNYAIHFNDVSACELIRGYNDNCFVAVASQTKDSKICEKVVDSRQKEICLRVVNSP